MRVAPSATADSSSVGGTRVSPASRMSVVMPVPRQISLAATATSAAIWPSPE